MHMDSSKGNEIIIYQPDETMKLKVRLENETVWLTQAQMAELFQSTRNNITLHIRNIFKEGELEENSVCKESLLTAADGKAYRTKFYNLDVIIIVLPVFRQGFKLKQNKERSDGGRLLLFAPTLTSQGFCFCPPQS